MDADRQEISSIPNFAGESPKKAEVRGQRSEVRKTQNLNVEIDALRILSNL